MIPASKLIQKFQQALNDKYGYIWGASGDLWTAAKQAKATREQTIKYGSQWIGHYVVDCSGLFSWAFKQLGGYMYHGSNTMYMKYCTARGELQRGKRTDGQTLKPGTAVFKYNAEDGFYHVGLYIGNDRVIEAKSTQAGVVQTKPSQWSHWGELKGIDYSESASHDDPDLSRDRAKPDGRNLYRTSPMMTGEDVRELQSMLAALGYNPGTIDGKFGAQTERAVRAFQSARALKVDGIAGAATMAALRSLVGGVGVNYIKIKVTSWSVNVRSKPDMSDPNNIVRVVRMNTVLNSVGTDPDSGWYILDDGSYISNKYVKQVE